MQATDQEPRPTLYTPWLQKTWPWLSWQTALVRIPAGADPTETLVSVRRALTELDPDLAIHRLATTEELYAEGQARRRLAAVLLGGFAATALVLGVIGLYGVMSTAVAERQREIGVRMALGAGRGGVLAMVLSQAGRLILAGIGVGALVALGSTKLLSAMLYQTSPVDPVTFVAVAVLLAAAGLGAALIPARRATAIDPVTAIRD
jgi:ABC-type antimicrobial peptide transport system permease subunit